MKGFFTLKTTSDLLAKLEVDFERVKADPPDCYAAFDFCVTAWHLVDWKYPNKKDPARLAFLKRLPVLRVCEHLAVGAKHFEPNPKRHTSVAETEDTGFWARGFWAPGFWKAGIWAGSLLVHLDGEAKVALGDKIELPALAELIVSTWRIELSVESAAP